MNEKMKKILFISVAVIIVIVIIVFFIFKSKNKKKSEILPPTIEESSNNVNTNQTSTEDSISSSRLIGGLPTSDDKLGISFSGSEDNNLIEYISFLDFYKKNVDDINVNVPNYELPINIKTDVINYYDISRKINIDSSVDFLNNNGFAVVDDSSFGKNFYDVYDGLYKQQIPLLITSDFLVYHYQQTLKEIFKNIEKNLFYFNLWDINKYLYENAKNRYEENLKEVGDVNDRVLEAQRLAAVYFAVSLKLLEPTTSQIDTKKNSNDDALFSSFEADKYSFSVPDYLKVDVDKEVLLIREGKTTIKSPVLLYDRNYQDFIIPSEYKSNAKLNNFYLATKWLSSNFPLYYKSVECSDCSLDFDDWRISIISASFISQDLFNNYELKNNWARIYKTLAFFKGLRGDLTYVHYRDALTFLFGENYDIKNVFSDQNPEAVNNLYKLRNKVLEYSFLDIEGGIDKTAKNKLGVKMLTDFYWPNDYIFNKLSYPNVSDYQGTSPAKNNITFCKTKEGNYRCNGFSLDVLALIDENSVSGNDYYTENTKYNNYSNQMSSIKSQISQFSNIWHYNNYWKTLNIIKEFLQNDKNEMPIYAKTSEWKRQELFSAIGFWVNLQLPADTLDIYQKNQELSTIVDNNFLNYNYIEPNLNLINEQLSNINMIIEMFKLLKIGDELKSVLNDLEYLKSNLTRTKEIMIKELNSETLNNSDVKFIALFGRTYKLNKAGNKILSIEGANKKTVKYDINKIKLKMIISKVNGQEFLSVGPVFSYIESH